MLECRKLHKKFSLLHAVNDVSFKLTKGEIIGLLGPNGSGKTTLLNLISGMLNLDKGQIILNGKNINNLSIAERSKMGIFRSFQENRTIAELTVKENLQLAQFEFVEKHLIKSVFKSEKKKNNQLNKIIDSLLEKFNLNTKKDTLVKELSYGQQKILSLLCCEISTSNVILLDEPSAGLSSSYIEVVKDTILKFKENNKSILLVEHNVELMRSICDSIIFLNQGKIIIHDKPNVVLNDGKVLESYLT